MSGEQFITFYDTFMLDIKEILFEALDQIQLVQNRGQWRVVVNLAMKLRDP
jgi:hypothetical protein